jgi:glycerol uptake facilitator-like aquaporin
MGSATMPRLAAEVIGTAMLVFFGVASLLNSGGDAFIGAVAFLVTAAVAVWVFGGHFNPWITLATALRGSVDWLGAVVIIAAQLVGGIIGALFVWAVLGERGVNEGLGVTRLSPDILNAGTKGYLMAILAETLAVFLLCCVFFAAGANTGIGMGLAYAAGTLAIFVLTAASMNFARSLGPDVVMLFAGETADWEGFGRLWVYALSGGLGAALAALLYPMWRPGPARA